MNTNFAGVVEDVKQLSSGEKEELKDLLDHYLVEERRAAILSEGERSRLKLENGELRFSSNVKDLMETLND